VVTYEICNVLFSGGAVDKYILFDTLGTYVNLLAFGNSTVRDTLTLVESGPQYSPMLAFATLWLDTVNLPCLPTPPLPYSWFYSPDSTVDDDESIIVISDTEE